MCLVSPSLGDECLTLALKGRCQNQLKRFQTAPQRLFGSRRVAVGTLHGGTAGSRLLERAIEGFCEVHFLPLVVAVGDSSWTQRLRCVARRSARLASWLISSLSQLWASGKRIKNSYTSPAKRCRGGPASSPAPAAASPGLVSPAVSPSIFIPQTYHPTNFHASFISFMDSLQRSTSSLTHLLCDF
ncbi:hypothetical protein ATANTOWER_030387, partial [Ataeniobius toweri]|nr:hypothetical protein [Ataeniobius toweri]